MTSAEKPADGRARSKKKSNGTEPRRVAIIGGNRIPFARSNGPYSHASNQDMFTAAIDGLVSRFALQEERIGEVSGGAVLKHARDFNLVRSEERRVGADVRDRTRM